MTDTPPPSSVPPPDLTPVPATGLFMASLLGECPRCGARSLFSGYVKFAARCRQCNLDFTQFDVGDGPATFLILIVGGLTTGLAGWLQIAVHPPFWVHILIWTPVLTIMVMASLRLAKAMLLIQEYRIRVREGRLEKP